MFDRLASGEVMIAGESSTIRRLASGRPTETILWQSIRDLCCRTGSNGQPIPAERWDFFSKVWIDPYEKLLPQWTYVAEAGGVPIAYLTGCPDTITFARKRFLHCTLPLLMEIARGHCRDSPDTRRFARWAFRLDKRAEDCFPTGIRRQIETEFPAHLHINVDTGFRGRGVGRQLFERYAADLRAVGVPGIHLHCGPEPVGFYQRLGFRELGAILRQGTRVHALGYLCLSH